jgi:hypothetical protein
MCAGTQTPLAYATRNWNRRGLIGFFVVAEIIEQFSHPSPSLSPEFNSEMHTKYLF